MNSPPPQSELLIAVYSDLRRLAASRLNGELSPQTLQATALVHEAWLRVGGDQQPDWANRAQFFSAVAEAMRRILVDRARKRNTERHGRDYQRIDVETARLEELCNHSPEQIDQSVVDLNEALEKLSESDPEVAELVKLRYFAGLSVKEAALAKGLSPRTAERRLSFARAWLAREMDRSKPA